MVSLSVVRLKKHLEKQGVTFTRYPVCPQCNQQVSNWAEHEKVCPPKQAA